MINSIYNIYSFGRMMKDKCIAHIKDGEVAAQPERIYPVNANYFGNIYNLTYEPSEIIPRVYLGNAYNASNYETLKALNIHTILNITNEIPEYFPEDFKYLRCEVKDIKDSHILEYIDELVDAIHKVITTTDQSVFVHCFMGSSRSATIVAAYLIKYMNYTAENAVEYVKGKRDLVNLNKSFYADLCKYEMLINKSTSFNVSFSGLDDTIDKLLNEMFVESDSISERNPERNQEDNSTIESK